MITKLKMLKAIEGLRTAPIGRYRYEEDKWKGYEEFVSDDLLRKRPLVSIVVNTYNQSAFIGECLSSIVRQRCDFDFEIIVTDDCSTDGNFAICLEYSRKYPEKIRLLHNLRNLHGRFSTRRAASLARGCYLALCEGDDYWCDDLKLQLQVEALRRNPGSKICYTDFMTREGVSEHLSGPILERCGFWSIVPNLDRREWMLENYTDRYLGKDWMATASIMVDLTWFREYLNNDPVSQLLLVVGDQKLRVAAAAAGPVSLVRKCCAVYRKGVGVCAAMKKNANIHLATDTLYLNVFQGWDLMDEAEKIRRVSALRNICLRCSQYGWRRSARGGFTLLKIAPSLSHEVRIKSIVQAMLLVFGLRQVYIDTFRLFRK